MKQNFALLAEDFSKISRSSLDIVSLHRKYFDELGRLTNFETEEELRLAVIVNLTCGRVLIQHSDTSSEGEKCLIRSLRLLEENKNRFKIDLQGNEWYREILHCLLERRILQRKVYSAYKLLNKLLFIGGDNISEYQLQKREIERAFIFLCSKYSLYGGLILLSITLVLKIFEIDFPSMIRWLGTTLCLLGLCGMYLSGKSIVK